jgi:hypothetical protein
MAHAHAPQQHGAAGAAAAAAAAADATTLVFTKDPFKPPEVPRKM